MPSLPTLLPSPTSRTVGLHTNFLIWGESSSESEVPGFLCGELNHPGPSNRPGATQAVFDPTRQHMVLIIMSTQCANVLRGCRGRFAHPAHGPHIGILSAPAALVLCRKPPPKNRMSRGWAHWLVRQISLAVLGGCCPPMPVCRRS